MNRKRPHQKVRTGCARCKLRRIKCDELKPQCTHCQRYDQQCEYQPSQESSNASPSDHLSSDLSQDGSTGRWSETPHDFVSSTLQPALHLTDLELVHHWTLHAHDGFGDRDEDRKAWQDDVVQLAFTTPMLLHFLLAVSAMHLATLQPVRRLHYLDIATHHQDQALGPFRHIMEDACTNITAANANATLACGDLTVAFVFAHARAERLDREAAATPRRPSTTWHGLPEWIMLHQGRRGGLAQVAHWIVNGPLAYQLRSLNIAPYCAASPFDERLAALQPLFEPGGHPDEDAQEVYRSCLRLLRDAYDRAFSPIVDITPKAALYNWIEEVPWEFFPLAEEGRPHALVLLTYAYVLAKEAAKTTWYMEGAAEDMVASVEGVVDDDVRDWIAWPRAYILGMGQ